MNIQDIYQLMDRFDCSLAAEFNLEMEGVKLQLKKCGEQGNLQSAPHLSGAAVTPKPEIAKAAEEVTGMMVEAPLVGTFYSGPSPEDAPFVSVGSRVKKGDVVGIIEAMKLMNEITAPCDGTVEMIQAENGQMVEFGQVLMRIV